LLKLTFNIPVDYAPMDNCILSSNVPQHDDIVYKTKNNNSNADGLKFFTTTGIVPIDTIEVEKSPTPKPLTNDTMENNNIILPSVVPDNDDKVAILPIEITINLLKNIRTELASNRKSDQKLFNSIAADDAEIKYNGERRQDELEKCKQKLILIQTSINNQENLIRTISTIIDFLNLMTQPRAKTNLEIYNRYSKDILLDTENLYEINVKLREFLQRPENVQQI